MLTGQHIFGLVLALAPYFGRGSREPVWITSHFQANRFPDFIVYMSFCRMPQFDYRMGIFVPRSVIEQVLRFAENEIRQPDFLHSTPEAYATPPLHPGPF